MDEGGHRAYIARTMIRMILSLLALLTGLAAPVSMAQARVLGAETEIGAAECPRGSARAAASQAATGEPVQIRIDHRKREAQRQRPVRSRTVIPAVQLGADRALE